MGYQTKGYAVYIHRYYRRVTDGYASIISVVYTSVVSIWEESVLNECVVDLKRFSKAKHSVGEDKFSREDSKYLSRLLSQLTLPH